RVGEGLLVGRAGEPDRDPLVVAGTGVDTDPGIIARPVADTRYGPIVDQVFAAARHVALELGDVEPTADATLVALPQASQRRQRADEPTDAVGQGVTHPQRRAIGI